MKLHDLVELELKDLIDTMRQHGITHVRYHDVELTIAETKVEVKPLIDPSNFEDELKKNICSCEHDMFEHNELNECLHGCDSDRCGNEVT
jgi:hypothetical protein